MTACTSTSSAQRCSDASRHEHSRLAQAPQPPPRPADQSPRTLRALVRYFLRLGSSGFGGPIALVGYMQRDLVEQRRWFTESEYRQGLALAQTMPGPLAAQLAMWFGYLQAGRSARPRSRCRSCCRRACW